MAAILGIPSVYAVRQTYIAYEKQFVATPRTSHRRLRRGWKYVPLRESAVYEVWITPDKSLIVKPGPGTFEALRWGYPAGTRIDAAKQFFQDLWATWQRRVRDYQIPGEGQRRATLNDYLEWKNHHEVIDSQALRRAVAIMYAEDPV